MYNNIKICSNCNGVGIVIKVVKFKNYNDGSYQYPIREVCKICKGVGSIQPTNQQ